jgi:hypothetical protein
MLSELSTFSCDKTEQTSSCSESDEDHQGVSDVCHSESDERLTEYNNSNVMEASDSDSNKTVLSQEKVDSSDNIENTSVDNNSVETSKATDLEKELHDNGRWGRFTTPFAFSKVLGGV